jgi:hypothetical protein
MSSNISRRDFLKLLGIGAAAIGIGGLGGISQLIPNQRSNNLASAQQSNGSWSLGQNCTTNPIHVALLPTGKIFYLAGSAYDSARQFGPFDARILDINNGSERILTQTEDLFCIGLTHLSDGRVLMSGGTLMYDTNPDNCNGRWHGLKAAYELDFSSESMTKVTSMRHGRWYPTLVTLANGRVWCCSGLDEYGVMNRIIEVYDPVPKTWALVPDSNSTRTYCVGAGYASTCPGAGSPCYNNVSPTTISFYPRAHLLPNGRPLICGFQRDIYSWTPTTGRFTFLGRSSTYRDYGTSFLCPLQNTTSEKGKILLVGGSPSATMPATTTVEILDFNASTGQTPVIRTVSPLTYRRRYLLPVILPNGKLLVLGGKQNTSGSPGAGDVFIPEIFDPVTETWQSNLPAASIARVYHSVALLLPDGRVWTAGSQRSSGPYEARTEIFSPGYLFAGARPTISGTPSVGGYGGSITIPTSDPASISSVSLVRLMATTHHYDANQRLVWLQILTRGSSSITVSAPINANIAPPGYYMIHILNSSGVPSVARIVRIPGTGGGGGEDTTPPGQVTGLAATAASSTQINLSWTANPTADGVANYRIYRSTTSGFTVTPTTPPTATVASPATTYSDTGLASSTTYYYRVAAVDAAGNVGLPSSETSATTSGSGSSVYHYEPYLTLTGSNRQDVPSSSSLQLTAFSVATWFMTSQNYSSTAFIVNKGGTGTDSVGRNMNYGIWMTSAERIQAGFESGAGADFYTTSPATYGDGQWHYAVVTYDGSTAVRLYIDGVQVSSLTTSATPDNTGIQPVRIGANSLSLNGFFIGNVDEVRIWNRALSAAEIADAYNNGQFNTTGQVLYLPFG